jgi:serine/threonine protein kinase
VETKARGAPIRASFADGARLDAGTWLRLAQKSTEALAKLHDWTDSEGPMNFVHGDISPDNVFFEPPDSVIFVDLSSATWRDAPTPVFPHDRGTVPYAAPEFLREEERASPASDTYALAATLLAAAVGPPLVHAMNQAGSLYEAATMGILWKRVEERLDVPADARSAIAAALQYDRAKRLTSSRELAQWLARVSPTLTNCPE